MSLLSTKSLCIGYPQGREYLILQRNINITVNKGEIISLMGQNGVGKTTFIKTVTGLLEPISGSVRYGDDDLKEIPVSQLAQKISLVLTEKPSNLNMTPVELISITRHPYSNWIGILSKRDKDIIEWALSETHVNYIANRKLYELSDGQLQKVMIARALAQETDLIILDEPAAHLDINNKIEVMLLLRKIAEQGKGILISTHDLQVSTQLSDQLLLFNFNEPVKEGIPEDMILAGTLQEGLYLTEYGYDMIHGTIHQKNEGPGINVSGEPTVKYWVERSLERKGFNIHPEKSNQQIICESKDKLIFVSGKNKETFTTIKDLLNILPMPVKGEAPRDAELL